MDTISEIKKTVQEWVNQQGHNKCWYYPELFQKLIELLGITPTKEAKLPSPCEFANGCFHFQQELFGPLADDRVSRYLKKWQEYEQEYILPAFDIAARNGLDLPKMVRENPGKNCVILLLERFEEDHKFLKELLRANEGKK